MGKAVLTSVGFGRRSWPLRQDGLVPAPDLDPRQHVQKSHFLLMPDQYFWPTRLYTVRGKFTKDPGGGVAHLSGLAVHPLDDVPLSTC